MVEFANYSPSVYNAGRKGIPMGSQESEVVRCLRSLLSWYECEMERSQFDDEDIPDELLECELALAAAELSESVITSDDFRQLRTDNEA